jgi:hypothetical protein
MVYSPVAAIRASSRCCLADSFAGLPGHQPAAPFWRIPAVPQEDDDD